MSKMSRVRTFYQCQACGYGSPKWLGKCPDCGGWNSFVEEKTSPGGRLSSLPDMPGRSHPVPLSEVEGISGRRTPTGMREFDRVLGGGIVPGSVVLVGGDPGIGKSTLLLQIFSLISQQTGKVLYVSGEESPEQIRMRADRLGAAPGGINLLAETSLEGILDAAGKLSPSAMVIDSIQTVYTQELLSAPGSVGQVRESAARLVLFAKRSNIPVFIIGHVTKDGAIAGPRVLEHVVDTVLYFEGDRGHAYRILRTIKNRFGSTNEIGIFEMSDGGLREVSNPSELFLSERPQHVSGTTVVASIEGTRPIMVEIQALVSTTSFGMPRRTAIGVDFNRASLLVAILEKRAGLHLGGMDIFINVVGGLKIVEPAVDLGIIATIASSVRERPIDPQTCVFGEVGLSGEVRAVAQAEARLKEASKIGFNKAVIPAGSAEKIRGISNITIVGVKDVAECLKAVLD
ncbi:MAG: DNA repair protein RadA [Nitrospiraceae bacterium]|nr:DNA repair protein RadA [Nitrospiraceae bacterium]